MSRVSSFLKPGELVVCLGGGEWGAKAARIAKNNKANAIIIDRDARCLAAEATDAVIGEQDLGKPDIQGVNLYLGDAVGALIVILEVATRAWVIPAIQGGFSGQLIERWLSAKHVEVIRSGKLVNDALQGLPPKLVFSANRGLGTIITSYMPPQIKCKPDCLAPKKCPVTGRRKISPMYELLEFSVCEVVDYYWIFATKPLGGIGGIPGSEVKKALEDIGKLTPPYSLAVGTSCRCHGLVDFFEVRLPNA